MKKGIDRRTFLANSAKVAATGLTVKLLTGCGKRKKEGSSGNGRFSDWYNEKEKTIEYSGRRHFTTSEGEFRYVKYWGIKDGKIVLDVHELETWGGPGREWSAKKEPKDRVRPSEDSKQIELVGKTYQVTYIDSKKITLKPVNGNG